MMRVASFRIHQSLVEKPLTIEDFWPIDGNQIDEEQNELIMPDELIEQVLNAHNLKRE